MRHPGFFPQLGRAEVRAVASLIFRVGGSRLACVMTPEVTVPCVQCRRLLVTAVSPVRQELYFSVVFHGQGPQYRSRRLLGLLLTEVIRRGKLLVYRSCRDWCKTVIQSLEDPGHSREG